MQAATTEKPEAALEDVTPAIAGDYTPASSESSLDDLLAEFDRQVPKPEPAADTAQPNADATAPPQDDIESFLQGLGTSEDKQRADSLQGEVDSLRAAEHRRQELEAFESYCGDLQKQMPSHVPADYVRAKLEALAHNPEIALAWDLRGVDRSAAKIELQRVQFELSQLQRDPTADQ